MQSRGLMPAKGAVRAERLEAFKAGEGIRVGRAAREFATSKTMASATNIRTRKGANFFEKTKSGKFKKNGRGWWQIAVDRELTLRESGRGFLAHSQRFSFYDSGERVAIKRIQRNLSRYGPNLGEFSISATTASGTASFKWGGFSELSNEAVKAMGRTKGQAAIARAISATTENMIPYIERKLGEDAVKSFR